MSPINLTLSSNYDNELGSGQQEHIAFCTLDITFYLSTLISVHLDLFFARVMCMSLLIGVMSIIFLIPIIFLIEIAVNLQLINGDN